MKKVLKIFLTAALALSVYFSSSLTVSAAGTSAKACVVMEAGSGRILYSKNPDERLPEASTTKIMTALVVADSVFRMKPGVLSCEEGFQDESYYSGLLEYPQYTRPEAWHGLKVPPVLLSGNHAAIAKWRAEQALLRTKTRRPDLYEAYCKKVNGEK